MYGITDGYIFNTKNVNSDLDSAIIDARRANKISVVYKWTGNLAGDFEVWASNDDLGGMGIGFFETNVTFDTNPTGTPDIAEQEFDAPNKYYMIKFDHTIATAGNLYMNATTKPATSIAIKPKARFADANFTNTSPRYLSYGGITEKFAGGVLATRRIGGRLFAQVETAATSLLPYCDKYDEWGSLELTMVDAAVTTPHTDLDGWTLTPTAVSDDHRIQKSYVADGSSQYCLRGIAKANGYNWAFLRLGVGGIVDSPFGYFNLSTGAVGNVSDVDTYGIESLGNGYYLFYISALSDAAANIYPFFAVCDQDYNLYDPTNYSGNTTSGIILCHLELETGWYPSSIIETGAAQVTRNADQLYWASASVPNALRKDIKIDLIPDCDIAAGMGGGDRTIMEFDESGASSNIHVYLKASDGKIYVDDETGVANLVTTGAVTASRGQKVTVEIKPSAGQVVLSGFTTGNGITTDTAWSTSEGDVYFLQTESNTQQWGGLGSEPY